MRILLRPRLPVLALLLLAPSIPELLTGSTPVSELFFNPPGFAVGFALDVGLYGCGALLIREFAAAYQKGWGSILLLGAAYGIAEEGFAVHTFFEPSGSPVGVLGSYGHLFGVNWLWALALTIFHATYSIALPILLTRLWFPHVANIRWFDRGAIGLLSVVYVGEVVVFGFLVGHGPSVGALAFFIAVVAVLIGLGALAPVDLLRVRAGPSRIGRNGLVLLGATPFAAYVLLVLFASETRAVPAVVAGLFLIAADGAVLAAVLRFVGAEGLERSEFRFAVGMMGALFVWATILEFLFVPGILVVVAVFVYLLIRLDRTLQAREEASMVPAGARGIPPEAR